MPTFITLRDETTGRLCYVETGSIVALRQYENADGGLYTIVDTKAQEPDALLVSETPTEILAAVYSAHNDPIEAEVPV